MAPWCLRSKVTSPGSGDKVTGRDICVMFLSVQEFMTFTSQLIVERSAKGSRASVKEQGKRTCCLVRVPHRPSRLAPGSPELPTQALPGPRSPAARFSLPCSLLCLHTVLRTPLASELSDSVSTPELRLAADRGLALTEQRVAFLNSCLSSHIGHIADKDSQRLQ